MLQYVLAGLALGAIYAIASAGLVATFVSTGILNFAFGSMAYFVARFYYWLNSQHGWSTTWAGVVSLAVVAPVLGVVLYGILFRFLRNSSSLVKLVATIGLSVALPPVADMTMGTQSITSAPGLALPTDAPYHFLGSPVTTDQVITYGFVLFVVVAGSAILRFTDAGLRVRAMVDSEAMTSLSGTSPQRVSVCVWAVSSTLAGVAGVLVAPTSGLTTAGMTALMAAAFAAVIAARLRSLTGAVVVSLLMGVVTDVIQDYLPPDSTFTGDIIPSIPFGFILAFLLYYIARSGSIREKTGAGGPLDQAISSGSASRGTASLPVGKVTGWVMPSIPLVVVAVLPLIFYNQPYWLGLTASGLAVSVAFLSFTVVTGEGGMLWLSQIIFAGGGALAAAQFAMRWHVPVLAAVLVAGLLMGVIGGAIGILTIRLGDLYVGLVTLTFGLLAENLVFNLPVFLQGGVGVTVNRPSFAGSDFAFCYLALAIFAAFALLIVNLRRSTSGLALRAVRDSELASRTLGVSVIQVKVIVGALAALVAGVGGGLMAMYSLSAQPQSFDTFAGLAWLAVLVTMGTRSIVAAVLAGLLSCLAPGVFQSWVPAHWGEVPAMLFGLGAISVARDPDGALVTIGRDLRCRASKIEARLRGTQPLTLSPVHLAGLPANARALSGGATAGDSGDTGIKVES